MNIEQNVFSLRAEWVGDIIQLANKLIATDAPGSMVGLCITSLQIQNRTTKELFYTGEAMAEFRSCFNLDQMRNIIRSIPDGHRMLQTLRPLPIVQNSMECDNSISIE